MSALVLITFLLFCIAQIADALTTREFLRTHRGVEMNPAFLWAFKHFGVRNGLLILKALPTFMIGATVVLWPSDWWAAVLAVLAFVIAAVAHSNVQVGRTGQPTAVGRLFGRFYKYLQMITG